MAIRPGRDTEAFTSSEPRLSQTTAHSVIRWIADRNEAGHILARTRPRLVTGSAWIGRQRRADAFEEGNFPGDADNLIAAGGLHAREAVGRETVSVG